MSGNSTNSVNPIFGPRRNTLTSKWDILFDENPKEWIGFKPSLGLSVYPCYSCRDMFSTKRSFQDHINRRIMVLKYNCAGCSNEILTFYNRCSFLLHTRKHYTLNEGEINLCELDIFSLPVSLAGFLPHPNLPFLFDVEEEVIPEDSYVNAQFYNPDIAQRGQQVIKLKPNDVIFRQQQISLALKQICKNIPKCEFITVEQQRTLRQENLFAENDDVVNGNVEIKQEPPEDTVQMPIISKVESLQDKVFKLPHCLECNALQKGTMAEHYLGKDLPIDNNLKCNVCRFVASTKCALKAHTRIHDALAPYVCPDCGKDFPNWSSLSKHMDEVCFHLAKHVRFRCPGKKCWKLFAMSSTFAAHFKVHLKCFYSCSICNRVLFKEEDTQHHIGWHQEPCTFRKVYDCTLCTNIGTLTEQNVREHVDMHTTDTSRCMYVYLCKACRSYFRSTTTYATHVLKCSTKQSAGQAKKYDVSRYVTRNCETCSNKIIFSEEKPIKVCNKCRQQTQKSKTTTTKRYFCVLCNTQILLHEKSSHIRECKYGKPLVLVPKLSLSSLDSRSFSSSSSELDSSSSPTKFDRLRRNRLTDSKGDDGLKKKRRRYTYINNNKIKKNEKEVQLDLTADEPMQFNGTYHCKVCKFESTDRATFHDHIKAHRDISTAYQCMECAECFVVKPSLIKHLLHYHNIRDYESYLRENDCYDMEAVKELEDSMKLAPGESKEPVKENQCRVCRQQFEDGTALNKHFRIHGMAFLLKNTK